MKTTLLIIGTAVLFSIGSVVTTIYASPEHKQAEKKGGHHEHAEGGHTGGHMDHMNNVLQKLKFELGDEYNKPVPASSEAQLVSGKEIFTKSCIACHGESGKGDGPAAVGFKQKPADFTDAKHSKYYSDQARMYIIKKGIEGTPMSSWDGLLSEKEIQSVHAYIRSLRGTGNKDEQGHGNH